MRGALISTDGGFRETVKRVLLEGERHVDLALQVTAPFAEISEEHIADIRRVDPDLVVVDFNHDPETGTNLARFLADGQPHRQVLAAGPALTAEQLLEVMRAGVLEYLPKPVTVEAFTAAVDRAARKLGWRPAEGGVAAGHLYALFSPKGGSGTTTLATNLGIALHRLTGKKTLLVDLDLELGEVAVLLGVKPRFSFVDMVRNFHRMDAGLLASLIERHKSGIHLLSAPFHPEPSEGVGAEQIREILRYLKRHYDYVVVDTSKSFSANTVAAFDEAERVFLVTNVDLPSLRNLQRCVPLLDRVVGRDRSRLRLVVNRHQESDVISLKDVQRSLGLDVYWTLSNDYQAVIHSINSAQPVVGNGKSRYARDVQALGADLAGIGARKGSGRGRGIFGRLRRQSRQP